ncbi:hypothetical protein F1188_20055 [Roseospira marina]|uniref:Uncharacterized protein n=1 Tax=Roseospira marina TaxID=140057 RepID=A0A5M6I5B9_9PROT|nr:hypothetical protein [Roseospira marina]KAA5603027.1 hypothetical protein F1188_20055 [Roseospira marina]MBB4313019.1 hypothetical protein [Roseospira marina]MBB5089282.1 hypothetical protein [Roseospira marina]
MPWDSLAAGLARACLGTFGRPVTVRCLDPDTGDYGPPQEIVAIFDRPPQAVEAGTSVPVSDSRPCLWLRLADCLVAPEAGDRVVIDDAAWTVAEAVPDGTGNARLYLHEG